jgi:hypothetical protein
MEKNGSVSEEAEGTTDSRRAAMQGSLMTGHETVSLPLDPSI